MNYWQERTQSFGAYIVMLIVVVLLLSGLFGIYRHFFPKKVQPTSATTTGKVESGGVVNVTNVNNPVADMKQGIYGRVSSTRAGIGVFKEVTKSIDISIGGSKSYDTDETAIEVETRFKF